MSNICPKCKNTQHILVEGQWQRCSCIISKILFASASQFHIDKKFVDSLLVGKLPFSKEVQSTLLTCEKRFAEQEMPKLPLLVFGVNEKLSYFILAFIYLLLKHNIFEFAFLSMYDLVDAYFNRPAAFKQFLSHRVLFSVFGDEVTNEGAVKVAQALMVNAFASNFYPIFLVPQYDLSTFLSSYPDSMRNTFDSSKVKVVQL